MSEPRYPSDEANKFMLRLPGDMRDRIKADAAKNHRSMNAEILYRLEEYERRKAIWAATEGAGFGNNRGESKPVVSRKESDYQIKGVK